MASELDRSIYHVGKSKLLKMDVIEMTLLLKSIGFRLNSIDYDEHGVSNIIKSNENGSDNQLDSDMNISHSISVRISCSKSKMVSNLSYKYIEDEAKMTPSKGTDASSSVCTCPKHEICTKNNNSFWEVQSSGTFANPRKSIGALAMTPDNNTFSNLLPDLPTKSIALTQLLIQILLNQYQHSHNGEVSIKEVDVKSIMKAFENSGSTRKSIGENGNISNKENLDPTTPKHSADPIEQTAQDHPVNVPEVQVNGHSIDDFSKRNTALNETVNTEAFSSPKSELITSSPNNNEHSGHIVERDATIINNLNDARNSIDRALLVMKLNVTRNLTHEVISSLLTVTPENERHRMQIEPMQVSQPLSKQSSVSNTPSTRLTRRASIAGTSLKMNATPRIDSPKANRTNAIERRASLPKLSMVRRAVSGLGGNRNVGANNSTASVSSASKVPIQPTSKVNMKASRPSSLSTSIARRITSRPTANPSTSASVTNANGLVARKTAPANRFSSQATKLAKKS